MFTKSALTLALTIASFLPSAGWASVYTANIKPLQLAPAAADYSRGLDASIIQPVFSRTQITSADIQKIMPMDMASTSDASQVAQRIVGRTLQAAMKSEAVQHSGFGRTATTLQRSMQTGIKVAGREPTSMKHELNFALDPAQSQARVRYAGLANASVTYRASESKTDFELREKINLISTDVVYNHTIIPGENRDVMSVRWVW